MQMQDACSKQHLAIEDSLAKKTKQATQWAVSVFKFTGRSQLRFKIIFSFKFFLLR